MGKHLCFVLLIAALCLSLASCSEIADFLDGELEGDLEFISVSDCDESVILYHEHKYYPSGRWLDVEELDDAMEIGMGYIFPFPDTYFLVHDVENPLYIVATDDHTHASEVYVREGFDWRNQVFVVDNTELEVVPSEVMTLVESDVEPADYTVYTRLSISLKDEPRLMLSQDFYQTGDDWFFLKDGECWFLTDEFVSILQEQSILPA